MILVLLGTQNNSFHRLLEEIDDLITKNIVTDKVIVQAGYTKYEPKNMNMQIFDFVSKDDLEKYQDEAGLIITHGGVGSIITSLEKEKKVIAVARNHEYGEHVNNHQKEIVDLFDRKGYIIGIDDVKKLGEAYLKCEAFIPNKYVSNNQKILNIIEKFIDKV